MAAQVVKKLPEGPDWTYELKFDGYRALIIKDKQRVELRSRKNKDLAGMYRGIAVAGLRLKADEAVVDGEIVALDQGGEGSVASTDGDAIGGGAQSVGRLPSQRVRVRCRSLQAA
jgi:bifunctional non-homologous end joining protein LigD